MTQETVLIAGFSGRALAQSARRAGFVPLVVDGFGDEDLRAAAGAFELLAEAPRRGFRARDLLPALDRLARQAPNEPIGIVLGSGFEEVPGLIATIARHYRLIGCDAATVARAKDPDRLSALCAERGIAFPETVVAPPAQGTGWLSKRTGGTGGTHIRRAGQYPQPARDRYWQREIDGTNVSALGIVGTTDCAFAFSRQWTAPTAARPFRFGGAAGSLDLDPDLEARMIEIGLDVARALSVAGLVSLDFVVTNDGTPVLLEVNPRPGATLDVFDDAKGTLFGAHIAAGVGAATLTPYFEAWAPPVARAVAYLYADRGPLDIGMSGWPEWALDRPPPGRRIERGAPIATVVAEAGDASEAERLCRERLGTLEHMLYETMTRKETP